LAESGRRRWCQVCCQAWTDRPPRRRAQRPVRSRRRERALHRSDSRTEIDHHGIAVVSSRPGVGVGDDIQPDLGWSPPAPRVSFPVMESSHRHATASMNCLLSLSRPSAGRTRDLSENFEKSRDDSRRPLRSSEPVRCQPTGYPSTEEQPTRYPSTGYPSTEEQPTGYPSTEEQPTGYPSTGYPSVTYRRPGRVG
jgi:hypothetical protein